jgi:glycosyltransferase involved in cell wall biosynthesis
VKRRPIRVLYLLPAEGFGGAERQGAYHIAELPRHGIELTALAGPGDPIAVELRTSGASFEHFEHFPASSAAPANPLQRLRRGAEWVRALTQATVQVERRTRGHRFDLIFANRTFAWLVAAALSARLRVPYVIRAGSRPAHPALSFGLEVLGRTSHPAAAFYNCAAVEAAIAPHLRCPSYRLPNGVDLSRFAPASDHERAAARSRLGLGAKDLLVGVAARPAPEKGFDFLAEVSARLRARQPEARVLVAGEFGFRAHYEARLRAAGLGEYVRFLGNVPSMPDFFRSVNVVVLTSRERSIEASPNALLEAMASGLPVVSTAVGGVPELLRHGREGYLVREDDAAEFAARVLELLGSVERCEALGRCGRARAEAHHRNSVIVADLARNLRIVASTRVPVRPSSIGVPSCASTIHSGPLSTCWSTKAQSRASSSSPGVAI